MSGENSFPISESRHRHTTEPCCGREVAVHRRGGPMPRAQTAFLFDLDGTLVDSVYQHVLAWREALEAEGIELSVRRS